MPPKRNSRGVAVATATTTSTATSNNNLAAVVESMQQPDAVIPWAEFPDMLPHREEKFFLSIVVGQTHLHWAMHEGLDAECKASVFWKTTITPCDQLQRTYANSSEALDNHIPCEYRHYLFGGIPRQPNSPSKQAAWQCMNWQQSKSSMVHVYIVTLVNSNSHEALQFLFAEFPSRLYQLSADHFWPEPCFGNHRTSSTLDHVALDPDDDDYPRNNNSNNNNKLARNGLEIQRRANLKAAVALHGHPALVMDSGSFSCLWSFIATDPHGKVFGGGLAPNMVISWYVLRHSTGHLPLIEYPDAMDRYPLLGTPIPPSNNGGVDDPTSHSRHNNAAIRSAEAHGEDEAMAEEEATTLSSQLTVFSTNTRDAIMADAIFTLAIRCRSILNHWLRVFGKATTTSTTSANNEDENAGGDSGQKQLQIAPSTTTTTNNSSSATTTTGVAAAAAPATSAADGDGDAVVLDVNVKKNHERYIVVTGAEKEFIVRLLQPNHGGLLRRSDQRLPVVNRDFRITSVKHLLVYAIGKVIHEQHLIQATACCNSVVEQIRQDAIGLRVAMEFAIPQQPDDDLWYRGTVVKVNRNVMNPKILWKQSLEADLYWIRFDDGDNQELNPFELYCALMKYNELGERPHELGNMKKDDEAAIEELHKEKRKDAMLLAERLKSISPLVQKSIAKMEHSKARTQRSKGKGGRRKQQDPQEEEEEDEGEDLEEEEEDPIRNDVDGAKEKGTEVSGIQREEQQADEEEQAKAEEDDAELVDDGQVDNADDEEEEFKPEGDGALETPTRRQSPSRGRKASTAAATTTTTTSRRGRSKDPNTDISPPGRKKIKTEDGDVDDDGDKKLRSRSPAVKRSKPTDDESASWVGRRVAKKFDDGEIYFGSVSSFAPGDDGDEDLWWIDYDDGDTEQFDRNDMLKAFRLYTSKSQFDTTSTTSRSGTKSRKKR